MKEKNSKKSIACSLTNRGRAVANQKSDSNKQWYERYFSQEYFKRKTSFENSQTSKNK